MFMLSMILQKSPTEDMTCKRPLLGPAYKPGLYGPGDGPFTPGGFESKHPGCRVKSDQPVVDDGTCSSDTSSRNPNCLPTYSYRPEPAFFTDGLPPAPYLNNFDKIGR